MSIENRIRSIAIEKGADLFGIAPIERFENAPTGFNPIDIYPKTKSIIVFAIALPTETLYAKNPIPFTHVNTIAMQKMDSIAYEISLETERIGVQNVLIPTDDPYDYWDENNQEARAILSLRHAAELAGLGKIAKNNLLVNKTFGNMIQISALLTDMELEASDLAEYEVCPEDCTLCLDNCPQDALDGTTIDQKSCRPLSNYINNRGFTIKKCYNCRRVCPNSQGVKP